MSLTVLQPVTKFHFSMNVADLARSIAFYRVLFGLAPAKLHDDYAKFELDDPPVVFSLVPRNGGPGGSLSHIGLRVASAEAIGPFRERLAAAGICVQDQNGTVCGYAKQDKLWVADPDGNFWEVYFVEGDVAPLSVRKSVEGEQARVEPPATQVVWEHYVTEGTPDRLPHADATLDEVRLTGTFNASIDADGLSHLAREAFRALKPGGKVVTHGLMGDRPMPGAQPKLPGLAAMVARVPHHVEPAEVLFAAGFTGLQMVKFTEKPWFTHDGVEMREVKWVGYKPEAVADATRTVLYKGPFAKATFEGQTFERGRRTAVPAATWQRLRHGASSQSFLFIEANEGACS